MDGTATLCQERQLSRRKRVFCVYPAEYSAACEHLQESSLFQGGSRGVYGLADGRLAASMLYLQGGTDHRDDLRMVVD